MDTGSVNLQTVISDPSELNRFSLRYQLEIYVHRGLNLTLLTTFRLSYISICHFRFTRYDSISRISSDITAADCKDRYETLRAMAHTFSSNRIAPSCVNIGNNAFRRSCSSASNGWPYVDLKITTGSDFPKRLVIAASSCAVPSSTPRRYGQAGRVMTSSPNMTDSTVSGREGTSWDMSLQILRFFMRVMLVAERGVTVDIPKCRAKDSNRGQSLNSAPCSSISTTPTVRRQRGGA